MPRPTVDPESSRRRILCFVVVLLCALLAVPPQATGHESDTERNALEESIFDSAFEIWFRDLQEGSERIRELEARLDADPTNVALLLDLGRAHFSMATSHRSDGHLDLAEQAFEDVLAIESENAVALAYHGHIAGVRVGLGLAPKEEREALLEINNRDLDRAVELAPDNLEIRLIRATDGLYTPSFYGRDTLAIEDIQHMIRLLEDYPESPWHAKVWVMLGDMHGKRDEWDLARAAYQTAIELDPGTTYAQEAEARLRSLDHARPEPKIDVVQLIAFFGFLIGTGMFATLAGLVLRDLIKVRRRAGMLRALFVGVAGFAWNGLMLSVVLSAAMETDLGSRAPLEPWTRSPLLLTLALLPVPLGLAVAYHFYKGRFMDLMLKAGTTWVAIALFSRFYHGLVMSPATPWILNVENDMLRTALFSIPWLVVYTSYPVFRDFIHSRADRWIFKRPDYREVLDDLEDRLSEVTDELSLMTTVKSLFTKDFRAEAVEVLDGSHRTAKELAFRIPVPGNVVLAQELDPPAETAVGGTTVELVMVLRTGANLQGVVLVGPRALGLGYLSEELRVLRTMAGQIARTWENLRLHEERRRQELAEEALRKLTTEAELQALRAQINPHFFFNALNSVAALIGDDPRQAESLLEDLGELFRHAFRPRRELLLLSEEMELIDTYLKIEQTRLGEKLEVGRDISVDGETVKVPALAIQPLVENAVKHGIERSAAGGWVQISAHARDGRLVVAVADSGAGAPDSRSFLSSGVGLSNVHRRLTSLYGEDAGLSIDTFPLVGTTVSFSMPLIPAEEAV